MSKGRTTGDRLDGVKVKEDGKEETPQKPVHMTKEQEDEILEATLKGLSEKKIKALISKMLEDGK
jgi:DNA-binding transcriptional regulator YhcF (GntR family)